MAERVTGSSVNKPAVSTLTDTERIGGCDAINPGAHRCLCYSALTASA